MLIPGRLPKLLNTRRMFDCNWQFRQPSPNLGGIDAEEAFGRFSYNNNSLVRRGHLQETAAGDSRRAQRTSAASNFGEPVARLHAHCESAFVSSNIRSGAADAST